MSVRRGTVMVTFGDLYEKMFDLDPEDSFGHVLAVEVDHLSRALYITYFNSGSDNVLDGSQARTDRWPR